MAELKTLFWNTWYDVQDGKFDDGGKVLRYLEQLIKDHDPDVVGLNEVMVDRKQGSSKIIALLQKAGYHTEFSPFFEHSDHSVTGNVFASKLQPKQIVHHHLEGQLGIDKPKHPRYVQSHLLEAQLKLADQTVAIFVTHLCSLAVDQWLTHRRHRAGYEKVLKASKVQNVIVGGDFNETKYMFPWLAPSKFHVLTGTVRNPTWRWRGRKHMLIHGNLDRVLYSKQSNLVQRSFTVLNRGPSDHAPLLAIFEVATKDS